MDAGRWANVINWAFIMRASASLERRGRVLAESEDGEKVLEV